MIDRFVERRRERWRRLQELLDRADRRRLHRLEASELAELGRLYRQTTADLAIARRDYPAEEVTVALNALVARGHHAVYVDRGFDAARAAQFLLEDFPRTFRFAGGFVLAAFLLMFVPALLAWVAVVNSPAARQALVPPRAELMVREARAPGRWADIQPEFGSSTSSFIMTNNIRVSFLAYAGGMLGGLGTVYVLAGNGLHLGAIAGAAHLEGAGGALWTFVAAHGPIELTVIFIAGGAGLMLGWAMLQPGLLSRRDALTVAARRSFVLIAGCVPLLVVAGTIEGFLSPSALPWGVKAGAALVDGTLLYAYLLLAGRRTKDEGPRTNDEGRLSAFVRRPALDPASRLELQIAVDQRRAQLVGGRVDRDDARSR
jgi:uncharacterized membrane protein SpoIIM required for sporulation